MKLAKLNIKDFKSYAYTNSLYAKLSTKKISFISKPLISEDQKAKVCFCLDPNGVYIELVEIIL